MRLALVTCRAIAQPTEDERLLIASARARNIEAERVVWNDPTIDWTAFDVALLRSTWDYHKNLAAFRDWLDTLESVGLPCLNPISLLRWNLDKHYLADLERAGIETPPTRFLDRADLARLDTLLADFDSEYVVVKPTVSATAWRTCKLHREDFDGIHRAVAEILEDSAALLQPYLPEIEKGEASLLFFDGVYSHAYLKRPREGDFRVQSEFGGQYEPLEPTPRVIDAAARALAVPSPLPLYARVDGVLSGETFMLMELELIEPDLMLSFAPKGADPFLAALLNRISA